MHIRELHWIEPVAVMRSPADRPRLTFLDSATKHEPLGRYSYVACDPVQRLHDCGRTGDAVRAISADQVARERAVEIDASQVDPDHLTEAASTRIPAGSARQKLLLEPVASV